MVGAVLPRAAEVTGQNHTGPPRGLPFSARSWGTAVCVLRVLRVLQLEGLPWHDSCPISHTALTPRVVTFYLVSDLPPSAPLGLPEHPASLLLSVRRVHLGSASHEVAQHEVCAARARGQGSRRGNVVP